MVNNMKDNVGSKIINVYSSVKIIPWTAILKYSCVYLGRKSALCIWGGGGTPPHGLYTPAIITLKIIQNVQL